MNERIHRPEDNQYRHSLDNDSDRTSRYRSTPYYANDFSDLSMEELDEEDELAFNLAGVTQYNKAYIASNNIDVSQLDSANKLALAAKFSVSFLPAQLSVEVLKIFTPATVASMSSVLAVYNTTYSCFNSCSSKHFIILIN